MSASLVGSEMCIRDRHRATSRPTGVAITDSSSSRFTGFIWPITEATSLCFFDAGAGAGAGVGAGA
eukprot:5582725-Alexandrium_andersonii.AAC.1